MGKVAETGKKKRNAGMARKGGRDVWVALEEGSMYLS